MNIASRKRQTFTNAQLVLAQVYLEPVYGHLTKEEQAPLRECDDAELQRIDLGMKHQAGKEGKYSVARAGGAMATSLS